MVINAYGYEKIEDIRPMWSALTACNAAASTYFSSYYKTFQFEIRKGFLEEKIRAGSEVCIFLPEGMENGGFCLAVCNGAASSGVIEMIYVNEALRGQGLGSALMERALDFLYGRGVDQISLEVAFGNERAVQFYQRYGFHPFTVSMLRLPPEK